MEKATNVGQFLSRGIMAKAIADKHFPQDCPEREVLLDIDCVFTLLWEMIHSLERTRSHLELVRSITVTLPEDREIITLALTLEKMAAKEQDKDRAETLKRSSEVLHIWYRLYLNLWQLMGVSDELRFRIGQPEGYS